jgi:hypothetical protein
VRLLGTNFGEHSDGFGGFQLSDRATPYADLSTKHNNCRMAGVMSTVSWLLWQIGNKQEGASTACRSSTSDHTWMMTTACS